MAKEQKGFITYGDFEAVADELTDEQLGQIMRAKLKYFNSGKAPKFEGILKYVWIPIQQQMDRDSESYEKKCAKMRENANKRWAKTNNSESMQLHPNDANTKTNTDTNTKTDTDTTTTTNTDTKDRGGGGCSDEFDLWKKLTPEDIDKIYDAYPDSGGFLIEEVVADVKQKRKKIKNAASYILGYAKKVGWDDKAEHGPMPWEVS